ncbi:MAG: aldo/keto reductase [Thermoleophilia bacterium]
MRYRRLPRADLTVSEVGLGAWTLGVGWEGESDEREALALVRAALDAGVTLVDSSDRPRAQELVGRACAGREEAVVHAVTVPADPAGLAGACAAAAERLGAAPGIVQLAEPPLTMLRSRDLADAVGELVGAGRAGCVGVRLGGRAAAVRAARAALAVPAVTSIALPYNLLEPEPAAGLAGEALAAGTALIALSPLASGMLEGKYTAGTVFPPGDRRRDRPEGWLRDGLRAVEELRFLARDRPRTLGQAALKWVLCGPAVASAVPGAYALAQVEELAAAPDLDDLDPSELERVDELRAGGALSPAAAS